MIDCMHTIVQGGSMSALIKRAREYDEILNEFEVADWLIHITLALQHLHSKYECVCNFYPAPGRGTGYCFRAISFFLCFFVSNITRKWLD